MSKRLFIIPGHGAGDSGAVGNGFTEAERVRALAQKIKDFGGDDVVLGDFSLNAYKSNIIGKGLVPKDCLILELHIDSSPNTTAKGGHIIINANFKADQYDEALAKMISEMFPGRAETIVGRTDIANVRRAAECGYNYRLMECCFISNVEEISRFNVKIDELAKKILGCFKIVVKESTKSVTAIKKSNEEIAKEVIAGKWGNGTQRKQRLSAAGYDYQTIQKMVNKMLK